jgi:hypothetical protein
MVIQSFIGGFLFGLMLPGLLFWVGLGIIRQQARQAVRQYFRMRRR